MTFGRTFQMLLHLTVLIAYMMLAFFAELHLVAGIVLGIILFAGCVRKPGSELFPQGVWIAISLVVLSAAVWGWFYLDQKLYSVVYLFVYLQINKVWTADKNRDYLQICGLTFFHVLAASVSTAGLAFAPAFLVYLFLIVATLLTITVRRDAELAFEAKPAASRRVESFLVKMSDRRRQRLDKQAYMTSGNMTRLFFGIGFIVTGGVFVFLVMPRIQGKQFLPAGGGSPLGAKSGFSDTVDFGGGGDIMEDTTVVMRVFPKAGYDMQDGYPRMDVLRLRGTSLDYYDGTRWTKSRQATEAIRNAPGRSNVSFQQGPAHTGSLVKMESTIMAEPTRRGYLFGPDRPLLYSFQRDQELFIDERAGSVQLVKQKPSSFAYDVMSTAPRESWETTPPPTLETPESAEDGSRRAARSIMEFGLRMFAGTERKRQRDGLLDPSVESLYLQLPDHEDINVARSLAKQWIGTTTDAHEIAKLLELKLKSTYDYSLKVDFSSDPRHLTRFLTVDKRGHCEYFATSMVIMLRTLGIPSRIVNGYASDEWNASSGGYYMVRQQHAHSWVEAWLPRAGWITFDPTPNSGIGGRDDPNSYARWVSQWLDSMKLVWYRTVIDFDTSRQNEIVAKMLRAFRSMQGSNSIVSRSYLNALREEVVEAGVRALSPEGSLSLVRIAFVCMVLGGIGYGIQRVVSKLRRRMTAIADLQTDRQATGAPPREYAELLGQLESSIRRAPGQTPREFATHVSREAGELREFEELTRAYYDTRFGLSPWTPEHSERAKALLRLVPQALQRRGQLKAS